MKTLVLNLFFFLIFFSLPIWSYAQGYCGEECNGNDPNQCDPSLQVTISFDGPLGHFCQNDTFTITLLPGNIQPASIEWFIGGNNPTATYIGPTLNQPVINAYAGNTTDLVVWCVKVYDVSGCFDCFGAGGNPYQTALVDALITPVCGGGTGAIDITEQGTPPWTPYTYQWSNGATTEDLPDVPAGSYTVTATTSFGCDEVYTFEVPAEGLTLSADITPNTACTAPNGAISLTVNNPGTYTYQWPNGATSPGLVGLAPGSYTVTVSGVGNNCTETATYEVPDAVVPVGGLSTSTGGAFCGLPTGNATVEVAGGVAPFTYAWPNGATTQTLPDVAPGSYTVTVTAANGCTASATATVADSPDQPSLTANITSNTACAPPNGSIDLTASPAAPVAGQGYGFAWSDGSATEDLAGLTGGTYTVTATLGSCSVTGSYEVAQAPNPPSPMATAMPATCGNDNGTVGLYVSDGTPPFGYEWSNGELAQDLYGLAPGVYEVTVVDIQGCTGTAAATVDALGQPFSLDATASANTNCAPPNGSLGLTVSPGGSYTYLWTGGAVVEDPTGLAAGPYQVTVTQTGSGCTSTANFTVPDGVPAPDTVLVFGENCDPTMTGVFEEILTDQNGCDSVVISDISLAPSDTVLVFGENCDPAQTGVFEETLTNQFGCDSVVVTTVTYSEADTTSIFGATCDPTLVGVFEEILIGQNGCDSVVVTTVSLLPSDTTLVFGTDCDPANTGVFEEILVNQNGCDSLVVTTVSFSQADTTEVSQTTCDPTLVGVFGETLTGQNGCDSVVISTISLLPSDTTHVFGTDCDPANMGVFEQVLANQFGCDSLVVTTVSFSQADTTQVSQTTCDPTLAGVFGETLTGQNGCDSVVVTTVSLLPSDTTLVFGTDCDLANTGVFEQVLANQFGCDSVVVTTVSFSQADTTEVSQTTCDPTLVGVFEETLTGLNGCDSVVIETISLLPSDTTHVFGTDCDPANTGVFEQVLANQYGCDSVVVTDILFAQGDTTYISDTSCDLANTGVFTSVLTTQQGCDSVVVLSVGFAESDTTLFSSTTCDPALAGIFWQDLTSADGCDSVVQTVVAWAPAGSVSFETATCDPAAAGVFVQNLTNQYGCDSTVTTTVTLLPGGETALSTTTCDPTQAGIFTQIFTNQYGCDSTVTVTVTLAPPPILALAVSDFNGWGTSCASSTDGSVSATATGVAPFSFAWSEGSFLPQVNGLSAGVFSVTATDANGCTASADTTLVGPMPLQVSLAVNSPDCFGENAGAVFVEATGGAAPLRFSLDGAGFQASNAFENLSAGAYQVTALDANGCTSSELIFINAPVPVGVELGGDLSIEMGEGATLQALVNVPFDSLAGIVWTGLGPSAECPTCPEQTVYPFITSAFSVSVVGENGCTDADTLTVFVDRRKQLFVPNAFSPNGDGINDVLFIFAKPGVVINVRSFLVFDRWGGLVFRGEGLLPDDPAGGWDGSFRGLPLSPGVFAWWAEVEFVDGAVALFEGDVTLVR